MSSIRVAVACLLAAAVLPKAQAGVVLTIDDAVALAMKGNRQVQSAALEVVRATEETAALATKRLPQFQTYALGGEPLRRITTTIPGGAFGSYPATGPIPAGDTEVTTPRTFSAFVLGQATQPLTQLYKVHLDLAVSRISEDLAKERLRRQRQETAQFVRELYHQIAQTQTQIESAAAREKTLMALQAETDRQLAQQGALKADSLSVRARLSETRYQLFNLRDAHKTQKESLNRLLGRDLETDFTVEVEPLPAREEIDLAAAREEAVRQRPEIREARLQTQKAETAVRRQRAEYIPDLSAGFTYASFPNVNFLPQNALVAGFVFQWQPFDWGEKRHRTQALRAVAKQGTLAERDTGQKVALDVNSKFRALAESRMLLDTRALAREAQREMLRVTLDRYREKAVLLSEFLRQESAMVQADSEYESALSAFWKAKAGFDRALGRE